MTYDDDDYVTDRERRIARNLAVGMHVLVVLLLIFGVTWQRRQSEPAAVVDLWSTMTPPRQEPKPAPPPKVAEPKPEPRPEPKPTPPPPKPEAKPQPKPDIALKEKLEKEKKLKEQQELEKKKLEEKKLEEKKKDAEKKKAEAQKKAEEKQKVDKERQAQEAEQKRIAQEQEMKARLAKEAAAAQSRAVDEYVRKIQNAVRRHIVEPPNLQGNPEAVFSVRVLPGGEILEDTLRLTRSSGNAAYDQAAERAIRKASPLPVPSDPALFNQFRELNLRIKPRD